MSAPDPKLDPRRFVPYCPNCGHHFADMERDCPYCGRGREVIVRMERAQALYQEPAGNQPQRLLAARWYKLRRVCHLLWVPRPAWLVIGGLLCMALGAGLYRALNPPPHPYAPIAPRPWE
jgi:hypothetical protein